MTALDVRIPGAPLWSADEIEWLEQCPSCASKSRSLKHAFVEDRLFGTETKDWNVWLCDTCECTYLDPRPREAVIHRAYRAYFTHKDPLSLHQADNGDGVAWRMVNGYLHARYGMDRVPRSRLGPLVVPLLPGLRLKLDYFAHHLPKPTVGMACLDVGCGNGLFLLRAKSAGWIVKGIDFDETAVLQARAAGIDADCVSVADHLLGRKQFYNAVTVSHVLEHMHDPRSLLLSCRELLRPDGFLWLATPNVASLGHMYFGTDWYGLDVPRHLVLFNPTALCQLLLSCGFSDIKLHRRGTHASFVIGESFRTIVAKKNPSKKLPLNVRILSMIDDMYATTIGGAGEEIVVSAKRR